MRFGQGRRRGSWTSTMQLKSALPQLFREFRISGRTGEFFTLSGIEIPSLFYIKEFGTDGIYESSRINCV